jgi:hypothetical protein
MHQLLMNHYILVNNDFPICGTNSSSAVIVYFVDSNNIKQYPNIKGWNIYFYVLNLSEQYQKYILFKMINNYLSS